MDHQGLIQYLAGHCKVYRDYSGQSDIAEVIRDLGGSDQDPHSSLVRAILNQLHTFRINNPAVIYRDVAVLESLPEGRQIGTVDIAVITRRGELVLCNGNILANKNSDINTRMSRLRAAYDFFGQYYDIYPRLQSIYRIKGKSGIHLYPVRAKRRRFR